GGSGVLLRYLPTGQLDPAYGEGGHAADPPWPARAIAVTSGDGDAYVAGGGFSVARFDTVGRLDTSFGTNGTSTAFVADATLTALALQSGGRILLAGTR